MPGAFQAGAKKDWFAGSLYLVVTISAAPEARRDGRQRFERKGWPRTTKYSYKKRGVGGDAAPQKQDVTEEKGLEKKRVIESEGSGLKEAGVAPQKQDVTEEKGLEKKRVIEGEGSGFPPEARRDGREGFGKEEGD